MTGRPLFIYRKSTNLPHIGGKLVLLVGQNSCSKVKLQKIKIAAFTMMNVYACSLNWLFDCSWLYTKRTKEVTKQQMSRWNGL